MEIRIESVAMPHCDGRTECATATVERDSWNRMMKVAIATADICYIS